MSSEQRTIQKALGGAEDLLFGQGAVSQTRAGQDVTISKINAETIPYTGDAADGDKVSVKTQLDTLSEALAIADKSAAKLLDLTKHTYVKILSSDGGDFKVVTNLTPGYYSDDGGDACGTVIVPTGGDGTIALQRVGYLDLTADFFLTPAEFSAVKNYSFTTDVTTSCQTALDVSHQLNENLYFPAGGYLVTGLTLPGTATGTDERTKGWRVYGQGTGEALAIASPIGGTIFKSTTDAPIVQDILDTDPSSAGSKTIEYIRFDGASTTPVVKLVSFAGNSRMQDCIIHQRGVGDGCELGTNYLAEVRRCFAFNSDYVTYSLGAARTGVAWKLSMLNDGGLVVLDKCSGRGFKEAIVVDGQGSAKAISTKITNCQASVTYNAVRIEDGNGTIIENTYCEGGDQGTGIIDKGQYTKIINNYIGAGYTIGIDASDTVVGKGTVVNDNLISLGATVNAIGIKVASSATFGGYNKTVKNNSIVTTAGTNGTTGIQITGTDPRLAIDNNSFTPKTAWTGTGALKIDDQSSGVYGITQGVSDSYEFPVLSKGGIVLFDRHAILTESDVTSNVLTLTDSISYFEINPTIATTVTSFEAGDNSARIIILGSTGTNLTINDGARIALDGSVAFTGVGVITFIVRRIGGLSYAYEVSRTAL